MPLDFGFGDFSFGSDVGSLATQSGIGDFAPFDIAGSTNQGGLGLSTFGKMTMPGVAEAAGGGGGGGFWSGVGDTIKDWAGPVSKMLGAGVGIAQIPLAIKGLEASKRGQDIMERNAALAERAATPGITAEEQLFPAGTKALMTGELPPELQTQVETQVNLARQQMLQRLAGAGIDPETANSMIAGQIEQLRNQLTMQAAQSLLQGGATTAGTAGNAATAGNLGTQELTQAGGAVQGANQAFYRMMGMM